MSDKTLAQKLLIKKGYTVLLLNAPAGYRAVLGELPPDVTLLTSPPGYTVDLVQLFVTSAEELDARLPGMRRLVKPKGLLWVSYPKGTSGVKTDINRDSIWAYARTVGWEAVANVSVNEVWSALRLKPV